MTTGNMKQRWQHTDGNIQSKQERKSGNKEKDAKTHELGVAREELQNLDNVGRMWDGLLQERLNWSTRSSDIWDEETELRGMKRQELKES